jgi:hypothetical protein
MANKRSRPRSPPSSNKKKKANAKKKKRKLASIPERQKNERLYWKALKNRNKLLKLVFLIGKPLLALQTMKLSEYEYLV